jgi:hypothetical protein
MRHRLDDRTMLSLAMHDVPVALLWAAITFAAFWVTRRYPLAKPSALRIAAYVVAAPLVAMAHMRLIGDISATMFALDFAIYWIVIAVAHRHHIARWMREREVATARMRAELDTARERALRVRQDPAGVLAVLEQLADDAADQPREVERATVRLADSLRLKMESAAWS